MLNRTKNFNLATEKEIAFNAFLEGVTFNKSIFNQDIGSYFQDWWANNSEINIINHIENIAQQEFDFCDCNYESGYKWKGDALICVACGKVINQEFLLPLVLAL